MHSDLILRTSAQKKPAFYYLSSAAERRDLIIVGKLKKFSNV